MDEEQLVKKIESVYAKRELPSALPERVQGGVLLASVLRAIIQLYVNAISIIGGSAADLLGRRRKDSDPDDRAGKE